MKHFLPLLISLIAVIATSCTKTANLNLFDNCCEKKDYSPQLEEDFRLDIKGYSKTFELKLRYQDTYAFAITNGDIGFPEKYKFTGKLRLQFFYKSKLVREMDVAEQDISLAMTTKPGFYYKEIYLAYFNMPLGRKYRDNLSLKVTVIEPDLKIGEFGKNLRIVIGVSGKE